MGDRFVTLDDPAETAPRYCPDRPLPPYAYVSGQHPHPIRDPRGHAYGSDPVPLDIAFEWGVDLYNRGYLWEAHEAWEDPWRAAASGGVEAAFFRGLIQCAAACLKLRAERPEGARRLATRALAHLQRAIEGGAQTRGLDLPTFTREFAAWLDALPMNEDTYPRITLCDRGGRGA